MSEPSAAVAVYGTHGGIEAEEPLNVTLHSAEVVGTGVK